MTGIEKPLQKRVWDFIIANPGCTGRKIADGLAVDNAKLHDHLAALQDVGRIYKEGHTCASRWFPCAGAI